MKIYRYRNSLLAVLLSCSLCSCNGSPFSPAPPEPRLWVSAKVAPINKAKARVKGKNINKPTANTVPALTEGSLFKPNPGGNLWERMAHDFQIPSPKDHPAIQAQILWFQQHQGYLDRTTKRAAPYMYLVYEQAQQRNLPAEVVLLPVIESAYYPLAYSGAGAAGLWQLMPGTASKFGLKRNWWYDGRRDIFASTNAALDYLVYLQNYFNGNWLLALAAYDAGEGTVQAAIRRNELAGKDTDFWSLKLPQETMTYVPRMLALAAIIKNPAAYNIALPPIDDQPYLGKVDVGSQIKLVDAAKMADMSLSELKQLNPGYNRWSTVPNGPSHLLLPLEKIRAFKEKLATLPRVRQTSWGRYKIQRGDTIEKIAEKYNTSVLLIKRVNRLKTGHALPYGRVIMVPAISHAIAAPPLPDVNEKLETKNNINDSIPTVEIKRTEASASEQPESKTAADNSIDNPEAIQDKKPKKVSPPNPASYTIKAGETLSHVAKRYHVSVKQLQTWNHLKPNQPIKPGMKLTLQASKSTQKTAQKSNKVKPKNKPLPPRFYTVRNGDSLGKIAKKTGISIAALKKANHLNANAIKPGMKLKLPKV